jgi:hypothetical protein
MVLAAMAAMVELCVLMPDVELRVLRLPPGVDGTMVLPQSLGGTVHPACAMQVASPWEAALPTDDMEAVAQAIFSLSWPPTLADSND